jgi:glycosyltransferase involved in cell wall biosynthesis
MDEYKVAIVIPAFNEENTIAEVIQSVTEYGYVIVVNDASSDRTMQIAKDVGATVVNHQVNQGYDGALNSGFKKAVKLNCDAVITFDADGQHVSDMLPIFNKQLRSGVDLVLGIRPTVQRFAESIFRVYTRNRFNWEDPLCGMKGYSLKLYNDLGHFDSYNSIGAELASFGLANGYKCVQIPVNIFERQDDSRFYSSIKSNYFVVRSMLKMIKKYGLRL